MDDLTDLSHWTCHFIDEVQRLPSLLNTIQAIIDDTKNPPKFLLTGSSARKLRRGHANLLPGRLRVYRLGPLTTIELAPENLTIERLLATGTLPGIVIENETKEREKTLLDYAAKGIATDF